MADSKCLKAKFNGNGSDFEISWLELGSRVHLYNKERRNV